MAIYLGADIGTTSTKCLAVDEDGVVLAQAQQPYPMSHPAQGWAEQNPEDYWRALVITVRECVTVCNAKGRSAGDIASIALSTQGDTLIVTDDRGAPLCPALSWMDTRGEVECQELVAATGRSFWYRETGGLIGPGSSVCKIRWLRKNCPELGNEGSRLCYVPDFLAKRLCGRFASDVPSASWTPLYSPFERKWSARVLDLLDIPPENLPETMESGQAIGEILPEAAAELGLDPTTRLVAGAFDQAAAACGAGAGADGRSVLSCGTAWVLYTVSRTPAVDRLEHLPVCCHTGPSEWGLVLPFSGGSTYDWLLGVCGDALPGAASEGEPLVFIPHLYGEGCPGWRGESRGSLLGLTMAHTAEDMRLALMRGLVCEARRNMEAAETLGIRVERVRMVGGATNSSVWPQMIADMLDRPMEISDLAESASYGAAKLAAGTLSATWRDTRRVHELNPCPERTQTEKRFYTRYLSFLEALALVYDGTD